MCLWFGAFDLIPEFPIVIATNRDEFFERPTQPVHFWPERSSVLAGRDIKGGGTWGGVTTSGRLAFLTNYRDPSEKVDGKKSRGQLVRDFLMGTETPENFIEALGPTVASYPSFNLVVGENADTVFFSSRLGTSQRLSKGLFGLSNASLDTPWPKVEKGKHRIIASLKNPTGLTDSLLEILSDTELAPDEQLPATGVSPELEKRLSAALIRYENYGTRSQTIFVRRRLGQSIFIEVTLARDLRRFRREFRFTFPPLTS